MARGLPLVTKARHEYLSYYGLDQASVYVLADGVVKASVILCDGRIRHSRRFFAKVAQSTLNDVHLGVSATFALPSREALRGSEGGVFCRAARLRFSAEKEG